MCFGRCRMQADRLSAGQHPPHHHQQHQHQSMEQSANRSVTTIMFPPVSEQVQSSVAGSASAAATTASGTSRDRSSSSAFLLTTLVLCICYHFTLTLFLIFSFSSHVVDEASLQHTLNIFLIWLLLLSCRLNSRMYP